MEADDSVKGILKVKGAASASPQSNFAKVAKFDELNLLATFHPTDKDYGHMKITEPKTPFVYEEDLPHELDPEELIGKLRFAAQSETPAFGMDNDSDDSSDEMEFAESLEEKVRRMEFERRRKMHYKEFLSVPLARRLIAEEFGDQESTDDIPNVAEQPVAKDEFMCSAGECMGSDFAESSDTLPELSKVFVAGDLENIPMTPTEVEPGSAPNHPCYHKLLAEKTQGDTGHISPSTQARSKAHLESQHDQKQNH